MKGTLWCLHGAVGMAADWQGLSLPGWAVKRVDLWRFLDCCAMSMEEFGRALNTEARAEQGPKVLVGYSMGARLGLHALLQGGPWEAAVLIGPHPGLEQEADRVARREADAEWASHALSGDWRDFLDRWESQPVLGGSSFPADRALLSARRREVARSFIDWSLGAQLPLWDRLGEIRCPVLWCAGERDAKFRELAERAVPRLPQGELWLAPGSGHRVPWEAPAAFREKLGEFLERVAG
ncbi:alpha/beta fold hydrolase [Luteolibacter sp. GHJ8]|uniref:Alpha/beta fold hydrolase n=1 Tax=Luteolibacter rhizosphaerae TaxID=2989719 RepID=A0ABT3G415_9BACT|nr:alpha/beta fold hydrolase [Luteolibacter rhizosphaerae]MCW1914587.1 alpha/beta fold hydrolase [Luteolibacter rhizosphaerae]